MASRHSGRDLRRLHWRENLSPGLQMSLSAPETRGHSFPVSRATPSLPHYREALSESFRMKWGSWNWTSRMGARFFPIEYDEKIEKDILEYGSMLWYDYILKGVIPPGPEKKRLDLQELEPAFERLSALKAIADSADRAFKIRKRISRRGRSHTISLFSGISSSGKIPEYFRQIRDRHGECHPLSLFPGLRPFEFLFSQKREVRA